MKIASHTGPTREHQITFGLGRCRLCSCWAFRGSGNICEDCGHHYDDHATKRFRSTMTALAHGVVALDKSNNEGISA
jgi:hypothetical protein